MYMNNNRIMKERRKGKQSFFMRLRKERGFTVVQGIAILGVCLTLVGAAYTGYRGAVNTSVSNTATFVTSTHTP